MIATIAIGGGKQEIFANARTGRISPRLLFSPCAPWFSLFLKYFLRRRIYENRAVHVDGQFNFLVDLRDVMGLQFGNDIGAAELERRVRARAGRLQ